MWWDVEGDLRRVHVDVDECKGRSMLVLLYTHSTCRVRLQAQLLAEMDEEFGVGDLVSETFQEEKRHVRAMHG